jgi:hypothetical protein
MQASAVTNTPSKTPLYWKAQGMVTVPQPIIAFHVLNTIMSELSLSLLAGTFASRDVTPETELLPRDDCGEQPSTLMKQSSCSLPCVLRNSEPTNDAEDGLRVAVASIGRLNVVVCK